MVAVTVVSIVLALRQDHASMAVIGTIGGLGTSDPDQSGA